MGGYEPNPIPWADDGIPEDFHFTLLRIDFDHFEPLMEQALARVPALETAGIKQLINGPESFTPDGNFILGEAPELEELLRRRRLQRLRHRVGRRRRQGARRMGRRAASRRWISGRSTSAASAGRTATRRLGRARARWRPTPSTTRWPGRFEEHRSGRPTRVSPLYATPEGPGRLSSARSSAGSGRTGSRATGDEAEDVYTYGRQNWFDAVGEEHRACRERSASSTRPPSPSSCCSGRDAEAALQLDLRQRRRQAAGQPRPTRRC